MCYLSFGARQSNKSNCEYIQNLIKHGHDSVLEHVNWTFLLTGVSRAFTHQLVRHRVGFAFSQLSQQYHDESDATFVVPALVDESPKALNAWHKAIEVSRRAYREILESLNEDAPQSMTKSSEFTRLIRSAARSILPNATETKIVVTANARALRHFLKVRGCIEGDYEMRIVSKLIYDLIASDAPAIVADFQVTRLSDGTPSVVLENSP